MEGQFEGPVPPKILDLEGLDAIGFHEISPFLANAPCAGMVGGSAGVPGRKGLARIQPDETRSGRQQERISPGGLAAHGKARTLSFRCPRAIGQRSGQEGANPSPTSDPTPIAISTRLTLRPRLTPTASHHLTLSTRLALRPFPHPLTHSSSVTIATLRPPPSPSPHDPPLPPLHSPTPFALSTSQTRSGRIGISICVTPKCANASTTAFAMAGGAPTVADSPTPFAPSG